MPNLSGRGGERGEEAIRALGARLPEVAAHYRRSERELRAVLRRDKSLRLDARRRLHYSCSGLVTPVVSGLTNGIDAPGAALFPLAQTFLLHSKPGANQTIYLDFDGHTLADNGWTASYNGGTNIVAPPWDTDGNPAGFGSDEQTAIQRIWFRVAEDFAGFDVDVTTEYPGEEALTVTGFDDNIYGTRVLISAISSYFGNYGGLAYVSVFDSFGDYYKPALVFPEKLSNSEKNIAEAASHEIGHNLGLSHDGTTTGAEYYTGQGEWAPIMGVGYSKPIVHWSRGEYTNANNLENDLALICQNGLNYRTDDHGDTNDLATTLLGFGSTNFGIIERTNDVDFFSFQTGGGAAQFTVTPWERGANVHSLLAVYDAGGTMITNREVADTGAGVQPVTIGLILSSGTYYVSVAGVGSGDPVTIGYSDFGSVGNYTLAVSLPPGQQWLPTAGGNYSWTNSPHWLDGAVPNFFNTTAHLNNNITGAQFITLDGPITIGQLILGDTNGTHGFTIAGGSGGALNFAAEAEAMILKSRGTNDLITASLGLQDDLIVSNSTAAWLTLAGPISGNHTVTKTGAGIVAFAGTNTYLGATVVSAGTLALDATAIFGGAAFLNVHTNARLDTTALAGGLILSNAQSLGGNGSVVGAVAFGPGSQLYPGDANAAGTLTFSNQLALAGGVMWRVDLAQTNSVGGGTNDLVRVAGDLLFAGTNTIEVNLLDGVLLAPGTYTILTYGGARIGGASNLVATTISRQVLAVDDSVPGEIRLQVSVSPASLTWRGDGALNRWDTSSLSWRNGGVADKFYPLDSVTFDDSGSNNTYLNLLTPLPPALVTVTAAQDYEWGGVGHITGGANVVKLGSGTLTISNANDFSGAVTISAGVLKTANGAALGNAIGATFVTNTGALDLNGMNLSTEPIIISGAGSGSGAVINTGAMQTNALQMVTLVGDTSVGGSDRWDVRADPTASLVGNDFKLTKTGGNEIWLADLGETGLGDITVEQGALGIEGTTTLGNPAGTLALLPSATLRLADTGTNILIKQLSLTNANIAMNSGSNIFAGSVALELTNAFVIDSQFTLSGAVGGSGSIVKSGAGTLILSGSNTFTGYLLVDRAAAGTNDGAVRLVGSQALLNAAAPIFIRNSDGGSATLQFDAGVVITQAVQLAGRNVAVPTIQNLGGSNTLAGDVMLAAGGTNYWFQSDFGTLHLAGALPASAPSGMNVISILGAGNTVISGLLADGGGESGVGLDKSGAGSLTLENTNTYTGGTTLHHGILRLNSDHALGAGGVAADSGTNQARIILGANVIVSNSVVANSVNPGAEFGFISGADSFGATFAGPLTFNANVATGGHFAGPTRGGISNPGGGTNNGVLHITGPVTALAENFIVVRGGDVRFSGGGDYAEIQTRAGTTSLGALDGIASNAVLDVGGNGNPQGPTVFDLNGFDQTLAGLKNAVGPNNVAWVTNSGALLNTLTLDLGASPQSFGGSIIGPVAVTLNSGTQTLTKSGSGALNGLFNFTGNTVINGGTLKLAAGITLSNTPVIELGGNGTLDVTASSLTLSGTQTLQGHGTVLGSVTNAGVIQPGTSIGILTCSNDVVLGATSQARLEISRASLTNDLLRVSGTLTYGGSLFVTNLAGVLTVGDVFKLFEAASYAGNFTSTNLPPLGVGLGWQFTPDTGTLTVISPVATNPTNIVVTVVGNALELSWPADHLGWRLEAQTNTLALGLSTNWFDVVGAATTNQVFMPLDILNGSVFFRLVYP